MTMIEAVENPNEKGYEETGNDLHTFRAWFNSPQKNTKKFDSRMVLYLMKNYIIVSVINYALLVLTSQAPLLMIVLTLTGALFTINVFHEANKTQPSNIRTFLYSLGTFNLFVLAFATFWALSMLLTQSLSAS